MSRYFPAMSMRYSIRYYASIHTPFTFRSISESGMSVHIFCFIFGVHNGLILVKAIISRCCIADRYCDQIEGYSLKSKHFKSDQDRSDRTVGHTAENCCHSAGCTDRRRNSHKITHHTAKGSSNAERRYDLSPAESCAHSQCCKHHFPEKGEVSACPFSTAFSISSAPAPIYSFVLRIKVTTMTRQAPTATLTYLFLNHLP